MVIRRTVAYNHSWAYYVAYSWAYKYLDQWQYEPQYLWKEMQRTGVVGRGPLWLSHGLWESLVMLVVSSTEVMCDEVQWEVLALGRGGSFTVSKRWGYPQPSIATATRGSSSGTMIMSWALAAIVHLHPSSIEVHVIVVTNINELLLASEWVGVLPIKDTWAPVHVASMMQYGTPQPLHIKWVLLVFPVNVQLFAKMQPH
jgi:hypothetical protein